MREPDSERQLTGRYTSNSHSPVVEARANSKRQEGTAVKRRQEGRKAELLTKCSLGMASILKLTRPVMDDTSKLSAMLRTNLLKMTCFPSPYLCGKPIHSKHSHVAQTTHSKHSP